MKNVSEINWTTVSSSQITGAYYDSENNSLYLRFRNKSVYSYEDVSLEEFGSLVDAPSVGKYFYANIKSIKSFKKL